MREVSRIAELRSMIAQWRAQGDKIALVPTMGHLHEGHMALIEEASRRSDRVVVSIFVNPTQFDRPEDLKHYPRTLDADRERLDHSPASVLFLPDVETMYPFGLEQSVQVVVPSLGEMLEGVHRPGHAVGVATVVTKLLQIVQPDDAWFGEKDFQQLLLIKRLVTDLHIPVRVQGHPVVRAADGLALSSRNSRLTESGRKQAPELYAVLSKGADLLQKGLASRAVVQAMLDQLRKKGFEIDYVAIRDASTLLETSDEGNQVILAAVWLDGIRLLDVVPVSNH